jgi:hypothetical protein
MQLLMTVVSKSPTDKISVENRGDGGWRRKDLKKPEIRHE